MVAFAPLLLIGLGGLAFYRVVKRRVAVPLSPLAPSTTSLTPPPLLRRATVTIEDVPTTDKGGRSPPSSLFVSQAISDEVARLEGFRANAYTDSAGVLTIGYGHTNVSGRDRFGPGDTWTQAKARVTLFRDLEAAAADVKRVVKVDLSQGEFDALTSFVFNLGVGQLASSTLLRKLNAGDYAGAAAEFPRWVFAGNQRLAGLEARRAVEQSFFVG